MRLHFQDDDLTPKSKKGRALLAILAAEQRALVRTRIIDLLWSDRQEEQARASLRTLLADLKEQFNNRFDDLLVVDRERVGLAPAVRTDLNDPTLTSTPGELFEGLDHVDPELDEWLRVERERWSKQDDYTHAAAANDHGRPKRAFLGWAVALAIVAAVAAASLLYFRPWEAPEQPVVAVLKFKDLTGRNALLADGIAEELRIHLAQHPTIQTIGRESSESFALQVGNTVAAARAKLRATHIIEGTLIERDGVPEVSARLIPTNSNEVMWSELVKPEGGSLVRSARQIAARIANNVNETVGQGSGSAFEADPSAYSGLFKARQLNGKWDAKSATEAREVLAQILKRYPRFAPALALMAESIMRSSDHPSFGGPLPLAQARPQAISYADRAIRAAPEYGLAHLAKGVALKDTGRELAYLQQAGELSPGTSEIHRQLARALELSGDLDGALDHHRRALALEPLSMRMAAGLERALANTGRRIEIPLLVADFANRTQNRQDVLRLIQIASFDTGDLSTGYLAGREALRIDPTDWIAANNLMTMDVWFGHPDKALVRARQTEMDSTGWTPILIKANVDFIQKKMTGMGREFWFTDWAREDAAELLVASGRPQALVALYDKTRAESRGKEPEAKFLPGAIISAMHDVGRHKEAQSLLQGVKVSWNNLTRSYPRGRRALYDAYLAGYAGDREQAVGLLEFALKDHWTNLHLALVPLEKISAFRDVRHERRFQRVARAYRENIEREKRELHIALERFGTRPLDVDALVKAI